MRLFILGFIAGGILGIVLMAIFVAGKDDEE